MIVMVPFAARFNKWTGGKPEEIDVIASRQMCIRDSRHMCVVTGESSLISVPGRRLLDMMACDQAAAEQPAGGK